MIAGKYRGKKLIAPQGRDVRPTSDKVKEAVFSMVASLISPLNGDAPFAGKSCLDLFAGTGALGIEALSRGADSCVFVESSAPAAETLDKNIASATRGAGARVVRSDWRVALRRLKSRDGVDVAFADPPYEAGYYDEVMKTLLDYGIISDGGIVVLERAAPGKGPAARRADAKRYEGFALIREKRYGKTLIDVYERTDQ
ncbi:MAG: 16S rRNA (guanine(966)-N(2))-methyltransferase RsmD [Clostridiales Family XIII bacterium]|nr:16S rRNA (guanine(966)-N(2))-methyltransferase RsmD [Clostridiales Family XIII bacterium]